MHHLWARQVAQSCFVVLFMPKCVAVDLIRATYCILEGRYHIYAVLVERVIFRTPVEYQCKRKRFTNSRKATATTKSDASPLCRTSFFLKSHVPQYHNDRLTAVALEALS